MSMTSKWVMKMLFRFDKIIQNYLGKLVRPNQLRRELGKIFSLGPKKRL